MSRRPFVSDLRLQCHREPDGSWIIKVSAVVEGVTKTCEYDCPDRALKAAAYQVISRFENIHCHREPL